MSMNISANMVVKNEEDYIVVSCFLTIAGDMVQIALTETDAVIQILGYAVTADTIFFNPSLVQVEHT